MDGEIQMDIHADNFCLSWFRLLQNIWRQKESEQMAFKHALWNDSSLHWDDSFYTVLQVEGV